MASYLTKAGGVPRQVSTTQFHPPQRVLHHPSQKTTHLNSYPINQQINTIPSSSNHIQIRRQNPRPSHTHTQTNNSLQRIKVQGSVNNNVLGLPHLHSNQVRISSTPSIHHSSRSGLSLKQNQFSQQSSHGKPVESIPVHTVNNIPQPKIEQKRVQTPTIIKNIPYQPKQYSAFHQAGQSAVQTHMETVKQFQNIVNQIKGLVNNKQSQPPRVVHQIQKLHEGGSIRYHPLPYNQSQNIVHLQYQQVIQQKIQNISNTQILHDHNDVLVIKNPVQLQQNIPTGIAASSFINPSNIQDNNPNIISSTTHPKYYNTNQTITNQFQQMFQDDIAPQQYPSQNNVNVQQFNQIQYQQQLQQHNRIYHQPNQNYYKQQDHQIIYNHQYSTRNPQAYYQQQYQQQQYGHNQQQDHDHQQYQQQYQQNQWQLQYQQNVQNHYHQQYQNPFNASTPQSSRYPTQTYQIQQLKQIVFGDQPYEQTDMQDRRQSEQIQIQNPHLSDRNYQYNINIPHTQQFHQVQNQDIPQQLLQYQAEQRENEYVESQRLLIIETINNQIEQQKRQSHSKRQSHNTRNPNFMMYLDGTQLLSYYDLHQKLLNDKDELAVLYQQSFGLDAK